MSLDKELEGVNPMDIESPDDVNDDQAVDSSLEPGDADAGLGDDDGTTQVDADGKKPERPIENVRGELLRKQTEMENRIRAQMDQRFSQLTDLLSAFRPAATKEAQTFDDLSIQQLEGMAPNVPEENKKAFDDYLIKRKVDAQITQKVEKIREDEKYRTERIRSATIAYQRYPQLRDKTSELFQEVDRRLRALEPEKIKYNPRIALNLADDVASELGIAPKQGGNTRRLTTAPGRHDAKPIKRAQDAATAPTPEMEALAQKLAPAMKGRKFDLKRIAERTKLYNDYFGGKNNG